MEISTTVKIASLKDSNYYSWATEMRSLLILKEAWSPIADDVEYSLLEDDDKVKLELKALSLIILHISIPLRPLIAGHIMGSAAWRALKNHFAARTVSRWRIRQA